MAEQRQWPIALPAASAVTAFRRVRLNAAGRVSHAGAKDYGIGVAQAAQATVGKDVTIRGYDEGTVKIETSSLIVAGKRVYASANGCVAATGTVLIGTAYKGASGSGSIVEVIVHRGLLQSSSSSSW
jgi:hypothetical protein